MKLIPGGAWYHGSPLLLEVLRPESSVTQSRKLAEAFSHKPPLLCMEDSGEVWHNGREPGYLYVVEESIGPGDGCIAHPRTTMEENAEFLTTRPLKLRLLERLPAPRWNIRLARPEDAAQLAELNKEFNGPPGVSEERARESLLENRQELVVVAQGENGRLAGFACVQVKRSFCYELPTGEVTEVYVREGFRRQGVARNLLLCAQAMGRARFGLGSFTLLTGEDNFPAQELYKGLGFQREGEVLFSKSF